MLYEFGVEVPDEWLDLGIRGHGMGRGCGIRGGGIGLGMQLYADIAMIDAEIQAAPAAPSAEPKVMSGTWASLKQ